MFDLGTPELIVILVILLLLFGGKKLPELSRSIGQSIREIRKGIDGSTDASNSTPTQSPESKSTDDQSKE